MEFDELCLRPTEPRTEFYEYEFGQAPGCPDTADLSLGHLKAMELLIVMLRVAAARIEPDEETGVRVIEVARRIRLEDIELLPIKLCYKMDGLVAWILDIEAMDSNVTEMRKGKLLRMEEEELRKLIGDAG